MTANEDHCFGKEADGRLCRNKPLAGSPYLNNLCKKHSIEALRHYERTHPELVWYLKYRHLVSA